MTETTAAGRPYDLWSEATRGRWQAVMWLAVRHMWRGWLLVLVVVAALSALVLLQYRQRLAGALDPASLGALAENPAIRTLFGTPVALDDPGGFTVWRTGTFAAVLVSVWGLLTATRITRGEEQAGRWDLLLAGRLPLTDAMGWHLAVLVAAQAVIGGGLSAAMIASGAAVAGSVLYGAAVSLVGVVFVALGMLTAQLLASRQSAAGLAGAILGTALLVRMIADGSGSAVLPWVTPFGLVAQVRPYAGNEVAPLGALAVVGAVLSVAAMLLAHGRDLGAGRIELPDTRPARTWLLSSVRAFAVRRLLSSVAGWACGVGAYFLLIGLLAMSLTRFLTDNPRYAELAAQAGFTELGTVEGYLAALFGLLAIPVGTYAAIRVAADAADETDRRLTFLFALPVSRARWVRVEATVISVACLLLALVAGVAAWVGTKLATAPLGVGAALAGALNALPVALLCLGAAIFALGWIPQAVLPIGVIPAVGGYLVQVLAHSFGWPWGVAQLSPFAHVAMVPAAPPSWSGVVGLVIVAAMLGLAGAIGYASRDLLA